jgi:hypothetical protein
VQGCSPRGWFGFIGSRRRDAPPRAPPSRHVHRHPCSSLVESKLRAWSCAGECGEHRVPMGSSGTSPAVSFAVDLLLPCLCLPDARAPAVNVVGQELAVGRAAHAGRPSS